MAYFFNGATHIINRADAVLQSWPITLHGRIRLTNPGDGLDHTIVGLWEAGSNNGFRLQIEAPGGLTKARCGTKAGGTASNATTSTTITDTNWHSVVGEITAANARQVWLDNGGNGSASTSLTPGTLTKTSIGAFDNGGTLGGNVAHELADIAVWSVTLTADERAALAAGVSPLLIRPDKLEIYLPLMRGGTDYMGGAFTVTDASVADHPRVYMPAHAQVVKTAASSTQTLTPSLFTNSNSFFAHTVAPGAVALTPSLFTNSNSFFTQTVTPGAVALIPSLYTNSNTFFTQTVSASYNLAPPLFTNSNSFFTHTVTAGAVNLAPSLFSNSNTFFSPVVSTAGTQNLAPSLFTNSNTFFAPTVTSNKTLSPPLYSNSNSFFSPSVQSTYALIASIFGNTNTFFTPTVAGGTQTLVPALFTNANSFYTHLVSSGAHLEYPLAGIPEQYELAGQSPTYPLAGIDPTYPL